MTVQVPTPGVGAVAAAEYADGADMFTVEVASTGEISYPDSDALSVSTGVTGGPAACDDGHYNDKDLEQAGTYEWYMGDGTRPAGLTTQETADMLKQSAGWITGSYNDCSLSDQVSAYESYQGISDLESDITNSGGGYECTDGSTDGHDGSSVVDFGNIDDHGDPPLAFTCWWYYPQPFGDNNIFQADIRFNTTDFDWFYTLPSGCSGMYDLRSVAVHEFGHAFGMGHVSEEEHGYLTMSTEAPKCKIYQRTLGKGDVLNLRNTY